MATKTEPYYTHDCEGCYFLDTIIAGGDLRIPSGDAYVCPQPLIGPTIVVRWGNQGWEYTSGDHLLERLPEDLQELAGSLMKQWSER